MEANIQPKNSFMNWLGWFIGLNLVCVLLAALALWLGWENFNLTASGEITQGTVVRLLEEDVAFDSSFKPVFQFQAGGETYEVQSQNTYGWWNRYFRFSEGSQVEIRYEAGNPENAEINSLWDIWIETILLSLFTLLFAVGVNGYFVMRWRALKT